MSQPKNFRGASSQTLFEIVVSAVGIALLILMASHGVVTTAHAASDDALSQRIVAEDGEVRLQAIRQVKRMGPAASAAVPALITRLDDYEKVFTDEVNYDLPALEAVEALIAIGEPATEPLIAALKDARKERRFHAARALAQISVVGRSAVIKAMAEGRVEPYTAANALRPADDASVRELMVLLGYRQTEARLRAVQTLGDMESAEAAVQSLPALIGLFDDEQESVVNTTVRVVARFGPKAVGPLIQTLRTGTARQRRYACNTLGEMGGGDAGEAIPALNHLLWSTEEPRVVRAALWALHQIAVNAANPVGHTNLAVANRAAMLVVEAKSHPMKSIHEYAVEISAQLKQPSALPILLKTLSDGGSVAKQLETLRTLHDLAAVEEVSLEIVQAATPFLTSDNPEQAKAATEILANAAGDKARAAAVETLVPLLSSEQRWIAPDHVAPLRLLAAAALGCLGDKRAIEPLVVAVEDARWWNMVAPILAALGDERGGAVMLKILERRQGELTPIIDALGAMRYVPAVQPLIQYIVNSSKDKTHDYNYSAAFALKTIGNAAISPALAAARDLRHSQEMRLSMLWVLDRIGDRSTVADLVRLLDDPDPQIAQTAAKTLGSVVHRPYEADIKRWKKWWSEHAAEYEAKSEMTKDHGLHQE